MLDARRKFKKEAEKDGGGYERAMIMYCKLQSDFGKERMMKVKDKFRFEDLSGLKNLA